MTNTKVFTWLAAKSDRTNTDLWLPFTVHSEDTAGITELLFYKRLPDNTRMLLCKKLFPELPPDFSEERTSDYCRLLAYLHDIGKITPAFQSKITHFISGHSSLAETAGFNITAITEAKTSPHNIAGQTILTELCDNRFSDSFAGIIGAHHGGAVINDELSINGKNYYGADKNEKTGWRALWNEWVGYTLEKTGFTSASEVPKPDAAAQFILTGLIITADWIASNTYYFPYIEFPENISEADEQIRIDHAWNLLSFPEAWQPAYISDVASNFAHRFGFAPNEMQSAFLTCIKNTVKPGIFILEAPMGNGKTEAALASAEILASRTGAGGIYFGLPTQSTANGIFGRISGWAAGLDDDAHAIRLAHGAVDMNEEYRAIFHGTAADSGDGSIIVHEWFEGRKQALLADFIIATVDQFLLASLKQRHVMLRHLGLAGKIVIIDECHAYDAYMSVYLDHTLTWMGAYGVPVILLSATLPPKRRTELIKAYFNYSAINKPVFIDTDGADAYPSLTYSDGTDVRTIPMGKQPRNKTVVISKIDESALATTLSEKMSEGGCAAVVVNSVVYAQTLYRSLRDELPDKDVICFHSRFTGTDRAATEKDLLRRAGKTGTSDLRNGLIVVGTQVIEQSLDLDFDFMVSQLCPIDLLLQRAGRLHRHERLRPDRLNSPKLAILTPIEEHRSVYSKWLLNRTADSIPDSIRLPADIPELVRRVYEATDADSPQDAEEYRKYTILLQNKRERADKYCIHSEKLKNRRYNIIYDFLDDDAGNSLDAEASVRDGSDSIETLILVKLSRDTYTDVSGLRIFDTTAAPDEEDAKYISQQRVKLPLRFAGKNFSKTIDALNNLPPAWEGCHWLRGELLLLLDNDRKSQIDGQTIRYSKEFGLAIHSQNDYNYKQ